MTEHLTLESDVTYVIDDGMRYIICACPDCRKILILPNHYGVWGLFECSCGWKGSTHDGLMKMRYDEELIAQAQIQHKGGR